MPTPSTDSPASGLPPHLRRNGLDYYYLSVYPSIAGLLPHDEDAVPLQPADPIRTAYVHVPFCTSVCTFCSYVLQPFDAEAVERYVDAVCAEIAWHRRSKELDLTYLYFGGGTPSLLRLDQLKRILDALGWERSSSRMSTIEIHPERFDDRAEGEAYVAGLAALGITRASVGHQSDSPTFLDETRRGHTNAYLNRALSTIADTGLYSNVDLMYGFPGGTTAEVLETAERVIEAGPDSISTYFTFIDHGTVLRRWIEEGIVSQPSPDEILDQQRGLRERLEGAGYQELPSDFWARDGIRADEITDAQPLPSANSTLALGPGAYGFLDRSQYMNRLAFDDYCTAMAAGATPVGRSIRMDDELLLRRDLMFQVKNHPFVDLAQLREVYGADCLAPFDLDLAEITELGLATADGDQLRLTEDGRGLVEEIAALFRCRTTEARAAEAMATSPVLRKHNFGLTYPFREDTGS